MKQEDFCQALADMPEFKYQKEGAPNVAQGFDSLREVTRPSATLAGFSPLYDMLCTAVYPGLSDKIARKVGSQYRFSCVQARHWDQLAGRGGLCPAKGTAKSPN